MTGPASLAGVTVEIGGTPMTFTFDFAAMLRFEQRYLATLGKTAFDVLVELEEGTFGMMELVGLTWAGLVANHPDVTEETAALFMQKASVQVRAAIIDSLPDVEDVGETDAPATGENPRAAAAR
jgi:hypothetical protein